tara:strand:+ start:3510 stop:3680 length:171 start_codon:yes stop_codon:yes gene_type:complete
MLQVTNLGFIGYTFFQIPNISGKCSITLYLDWVKLGNKFHVTCNSNYGNVFEKHEE